MTKIAKVGVLGASGYTGSECVRLLLRHHLRSGDAQSLAMATFTLERMAAGGIYDHVAGGFHRYATDGAWLVPHFEKMLYDNGLLLAAYTEAWQVTHSSFIARCARWEKSAALPARANSINPGRRFAKFCCRRHRLRAGCHRAGSRTR